MDIIENNNDSLFKKFSKILKILVVLYIMNVTVIFIMVYEKNASLIINFLFYSLFTIMLLLLITVLVYFSKDSSKI